MKRTTTLLLAALLLTACAETQPEAVAVRSDIERSLQRRNPERSREDIREAVNAAVKELGLTCVKYNSYRFYRTADRGLIIASALARLTA